MIFCTTDACNYYMCLLPVLITWIVPVVTGVVPPVVTGRPTPPPVIGHHDVLHWAEINCKTFSSNIGGNYYSDNKHRKIEFFFTFIKINLSCIQMDYYVFLNIKTHLEWRLCRCVQTHVSTRTLLNWQIFNPANRFGSRVGDT